MICRHCKQELDHTFLDLGFAPPSNAYLTNEDLNKPEVYYPLRLKVCDQCWLVQTEDYAASDELFTKDYAYFSSVSKSWLTHARTYSDMITDQLGLNGNSLVIEVASNDGYLLKNFVEKNIPCLGIEPTDSTADAAESLGITTIREFFGTELAEELVESHRQANLIIGNNVYAHVPDINDFTLGLKKALMKGGTITLEFPHLLQLILNNQFDTTYHEHYSYLSLHSVCTIFRSVGLEVYDVEEVTTHGGSLRVYGCHKEDQRFQEVSVQRILDREKKKGLLEVKTYLSFQGRAEKIKNNFVSFLIEQKKNGNKVVAYGAAAKGNTLLNFGGVRPDVLPHVFDAAKSKQNKYLPGSHIPISSPEAIKEFKPDYVIVFPWNILDEIEMQLDFIRDWGGKFVTFIPNQKVI